MPRSIFSLILFVNPYHELHPCTDGTIRKRVIVNMVFMKSVWISVIPSVVREIRCQERSRKMPVRSWRQCTIETRPCLFLHVPANAKTVTHATKRLLRFKPIITLILVELALIHVIHVITSMSFPLAVLQVPRVMSSTRPCMTCCSNLLLLCLLSVGPGCVCDKTAKQEPITGSVKSGGVPCLWMFCRGICALWRMLLCIQHFHRHS